MKENDIVTTIAKKLASNKLYYYFCVKISDLPKIKEFIKTTDYDIVFIDKLFFIADLFLKRND